MSNFVPIHRERHAGRRWTPNSNFSHVAQQGSVLLGVNELVQAQQALPIVFMQVQSQWAPFALLGFNPAENLFVGSKGEWLGDYLPVNFRHYPFVLAKAEETMVLCVDESSPLLSETAGDLMLQPDGQPGASLLKVYQQLTEAAAFRDRTLQVGALLHKHQLIKPLPLKVQTDDGVKDVAGLFTIDEVALNHLPGEALVELRDQGALLAAYCQLLSSHHLHATLPRLAEQRRQSKAALPVKNGELDLSFLGNKDTLSFS